MKNPLAFVRDETGVIVKLGPFEEVTGIKASETEITLGVSRAVSRRKRGYDWQVTKRGTVLYVFRRKTLREPWVLADTIEVWWSTDELYASWNHGSE